MGRFGSARQCSPARSAEPGPGRGRGRPGGGSGPARPVPAQHSARAPGGAAPPPPAGERDGPARDAPRASGSGMSPVSRRRLRRFASRGRERELRGRAPGGGGGTGSARPVGLSRRRRPGPPMPGVPAGSGGAVLGPRARSRRRYGHGAAWRGCVRPLTCDPGPASSGARPACPGPGARSRHRSHVGRLQESRQGAAASAP